MMPVVEARGFSLRSSQGRELLRSLTFLLSFGEKVALTGRNGVGKSTLLRALSGLPENSSGHLKINSHPIIVPQIIKPESIREVLNFIQCKSELQAKLVRECDALELRLEDGISDASELSHGERRKLCLLHAKLSGREFLLLDEPSEDLDEVGARWLKNWLREYQGSAIVVTHDLGLLECFSQFITLSESGCIAFEGSYAAFESQLETLQSKEEERHLRVIRNLVRREAQIAHIARRRSRKKRYGRVREMERATPKQRLNQKRDYAQVKHGRMSVVRARRLESNRTLARSSRRRLRVHLPFEEKRFDSGLSEETRTYLRAKNLSFRVGRESCVSGMNFELGLERVALTGRNGAGKTGLIETLFGLRKSESGEVWFDVNRVGLIAQNAANWLREESLFEVLRFETGIGEGGRALEILSAHRFPSALGMPVKYFEPRRESASGLHRPSTAGSISRISGP